MVSSNNKKPLMSYVSKLMLLEAVKNSRDSNAEAINWLQKQMFAMNKRWRELEKNDK